MMRKLVLALFLLACCALPAEAANTCTVGAANVVFGTYTGALAESTGTVTVKCTTGAAYQVGLGAGTGTGATVTNRSMTGPAGALLHYALTSGSYAGNNWGNTLATHWVTGTGNGANQVLIVYGELAAAQYVASGNYIDNTITVTVSGATFTTVTTTLNVQATVVKDCIVSATALAFGNYTGALAQTTSTVTVTCTNTTTYTVGLSAGLASGATVTTRQMGITQPAGGLNYSLSHIGYGGTNWGNTTGSWVAGTGTGVAQPLTVYGQVAAGQHPTPGSYTDTITATVTY